MELEDKKNKAELRITFPQERFLTRAKKSTERWKNAGPLQWKEEFAIMHGGAARWSVGRKASWASFQEQREGLSKLGT